MRPAYREEGIADAGAGTESQRGLDMLDRDVVLADPIPEVAADEPATCKIRVEGQGAVHQRHHRADVLAEVSQRLGGIRQDARVVAGHFQCSPGKIDALRTVRLPIQPITADRGQGECGPVTRIARNRLLQKMERFGYLPCRRPNHRIGAQIEIVGSQIGGRTAGRTGGLSGLQ